MHDIGKRIKLARKNKGLTLKDIEQKTGISTGNMSAIENGKILPSTKAILALCETLEITPNWLLTGNETIEKSDNPVSFEEFKKETDILIENSKLTPEEIKEVMLKVFDIAKLINKKD